MKYCTVCKGKYDDSVSFCPTDGEVLEDDPSFIVGTVLDGQYKIESLLGKGGMGAVYLARHILLGDRVAIKILPPEVRNNAEWLRRFRREGQAARRFRHANAVTVYDLRTAGDGTIYMVMEYVEGHTLDAELKKRGRFTAAEAFEILEPIMSVLNTAHAMGVVHRDLKPENIMMGKATTGGESPIKLLDLGIAKMREIAGVESSGATELTMAGQVLGTPYYMSPEQWGEMSRDGNPEIDGRTDIYSLGLVAYEMISGKRAYSAVTLAELRREHISGSPVPLCEKVPEVPGGFSQAIERAISKDRGDRQATAGELAAQLRAGLAEATGHAPAGGIFPDLPHPEPGSPAGQPGWSGGSSSGHTEGAAGVLDTKSDVNAATIVTVDAIPTTPPVMRQPPPTAYGVAAGSAQAPPAGAAVDDLGSSVTVLRAPRVPADLAVPQKSRGKALVFVGAGVLLLVLAVVGVGGFFAVNWLKAKPGGGADGTTGTSGTETPREFGRYWFQVNTKNKALAVRAGDPVAMVSGQDFKFHLLPRQNGYLYIIGPGANNAPTAFLTAKPNADSGLNTNKVKSGQDFAFPADSGTDYHWVTLDTEPGTENYTIIFSPELLSTPAFLNSEATGTPLNETEQAELKDFLARYKMSEPVTEINDKDAEAPFVTVKVPRPTESKDASWPVVFEVRIQHK